MWTSSHVVLKHPPGSAKVQAVRNSFGARHRIMKTGPASPVVQ